MHLQASARGEVTVTVPPKLELRCPPLAVANKSLEFTLISWGSVGVDVDWKITKDGVQVAKGKIHQCWSAERLMNGYWTSQHYSKMLLTVIVKSPTANLKPSVFFPFSHYICVQQIPKYDLTFCKEGTV